MVFVWVLAVTLLWAESGQSAHLHRSTSAVGSEVAGPRRRTLHTTEGHHRLLDHQQLHPEDLPVALPRLAEQAQKPDLTSVSLGRNPSSIRGSGAKSTTRRKREPRSDSRTTSSAAVLGELGKILKDDETEKKRIPPDVKRQAELKPNDTLDQGNDRKQQTFEDWLRDEYIRNMALSIATVKKKRSSLDSRRKRSSRHDEAAAAAAQEAKLKLQSMENAVLADALTEIVSRREDGEDISPSGQEDEGLVARRLAQAYYLERLRGAVHRIEEQAAATGQQRTGPQTWGEFEEENMDDTDDVDEEGNQEEEDALYTYQKKDDNSLASVLPIMTQLEEQRQEDEEMCPALRMLTSDCASLEELLTEGEMSLALRHACNKHEVCYSCGEVFGLSSTSCDKVFLEDVSSACSSCSERALGQLLVPLRDQRVFYKRSVPPVCYRAPCVQRYLEEHY